MRKEQSHSFKATVVFTNLPFNPQANGAFIIVTVTKAPEAGCNRALSIDRIFIIIPII